MHGLMLFFLWMVFIDFTAISNHIFSSSIQLLEKFEEKKTISIPPINKIRNTGSSKCEEITDCFNCTIDAQIDESCEWTGFNCRQANSVPSYDLWFEYYHSCLLDANSNYIMRKICGDTLEGNIPFSASLIPVNGYYGTKNIYCKWSIFNSAPEKPMDLNFTKFSPDLHDQYALQINYLDGRQIISLLQMKSYFLSSQLINSVDFHYFTSQLKTGLPFTLIIEYSSGDLNSYLGLFIAVGIIVFVCIVCSIIFYKCSKIIINNHRRRQQERDAALARDINPNGNLIQDQRNEAERRVQEQKIKNTKKLEELFKSELKPKQYQKNVNEFSNNCTICLEEFKGKSLVVKLACKHIFHYKCLKEWCEKVILLPKCPNCNIEILSKEKEPDGLLVITENRFSNPEDIQLNRNLTTTRSSHHNTRRARNRRRHNHRNQINEDYLEIEAVPRISRRNMRGSQRIDEDNSIDDDTVIIQEDNSTRIEPRRRNEENRNNYIAQGVDSVADH